MLKHGPAHCDALPSGHLLDRTTQDSGFGIRGLLFQRLHGYVEPSSQSFINGKGVRQSPSGEIAQTAVFRQNYPHAGKSFATRSPSVVAWLDQWVGPGTRSIRIAPYRPIVVGEVVRIGDSTRVTPVELVQIEKIIPSGGRELWEFAPPLEYAQKDGRVITRSSYDSMEQMTRPPRAVRFATLRLAKAMLEYIIANPGTSPEDVPESVFTKDMKSDLAQYR